MNPDPIAAAHELASTVQAERTTIEEKRSLTPKITQSFIEERMCRLALSQNLGGRALDPVTLLKVWETLAYADASASWFSWNNAVVCYFSRFMSPQARSEFFGEPERLFAQSTRPSGTATVVEGGYRINGQWQLVSGCELADAVCLNCFVEEGGVQKTNPTGAPQTAFMIINKGNYEILDTWHVGGLRGSGSHDVLVKDAFTLADMVLAVGQSQNSDEPADRVAIMPVLVAGLAAQCLGIAQKTIDTVIDAAKTKITSGPIPDLRDRTDAQYLVTVKRAAVSAARAEIHRTADALWQVAEGGENASLSDRAAAFGASANAIEVARKTVDEMYDLGGTSAAYISSPLERAHRDLRVMLQHIAAQKMWAEQSGGILFGLDPTNPQVLV
jgi:alkylation response protein AidB-like acyl-CoA dehydrogenase